MTLRGECKHCGHAAKEHTQITYKIDTIETITKKTDISQEKLKSKLEKTKNAKEKILNACIVFDSFVAQKILRPQKSLFEARISEEIEIIRDSSIKSKSKELINESIVAKENKDAPSRLEKEKAINLLAQINDDFTRAASTFKKQQGQQKISLEMVESMLNDLEKVPEYGKEIKKIFCGIEARDDAEKQEEEFFVQDLPTYSLESGERIYQPEPVENVDK